MTDKKSWSTGKKLGLAALGAAILLVSVVLPAEYGIDPTGFGRLTSIAKLSESAPAAGQDFGQTMEFNIAEYDVTAERIEESIQGLITLEELEAGASEGPERDSIDYGIANWFLYNGNVEEASKRFAEIQARPAWTSFGYIAAESELHAMSRE